MESLSLLPPIIVLLLGFVTRNVILSLGVGVFSAAFIAKKFSFMEGLPHACTHIWNNMELAYILDPSQWGSLWNFLICSFLMMLGIFITLLHRSGAAWAYQQSIKNYLKAPWQVEISAMLLSTALCIDDYLASLTVGSVISPIADLYGVARAKLAYLVDAMAAPLTIICPLSSWVAAIIGFLRDNGVGPADQAGVVVIGSPFLAYLYTIPYIFYSFILVFGTWFLVAKKISFGKMAEFENLPLDTATQEQEVMKTHAHFKDFFLPIIALTLCIISGLLASGRWFVFGGDSNFIEALQNADAAKGLFLGGTTGLIITIIYLKSKKLLQLRQLPQQSLEGCKLMLPSVLVLILAWTLGGILRVDLGTGTYLANLVSSSIPVSILPGIFFFLSALTSFAIGSSWGTAAIMFPIAVQMVTFGQPMGIPLQEASFLFPVLGAILSGAVAGDHISPISDTTMMTAISVKIPHQDHVESQLSYAMPMILCTGATYIIFGFLIPILGITLAHVVSLFIGIVSGMLLFKKLNGNPPIFKKINLADI